jgi:hypothetical protein
MFRKQGRYHFTLPAERQPSFFALRFWLAGNPSKQTEGSRLVERGKTMRAN